MTKREQTLIMIILILILTSISIYFTYLKEMEQKKIYLTRQNQAKYQVYSIDIPKNIDFAGEPVPLHKPEVLEKLDREIHENTFRHATTMLTIKKVRRFFPEISRILKMHGIPDDFKYVAVAESNLRNVTSPAGAVGFWQFMEETARQYGLEVNEEVDERLDPIKATHAACKYFKEAYEVFGNWTNVAASYNRGIAGLKRAIKHQQQNNFYDLRLNPETGRYIYRIVALKEVIGKPKKYGFNIKRVHYYKPKRYRTIKVSQPIPDLVNFAHEQGVTYKTLRDYNPWMNHISLSNPKGKTYVIKLPMESDWSPDMNTRDSSKTDSVPSGDVEVTNEDSSNTDTL